VKKNVFTIFIIISLAFTCNALLPGNSTPPTTGSKILNDIMDNILRIIQDNSIYLKLRSGQKVEKLPDLSYKKAQIDNEKSKSFLEKLLQIKPSDLSYKETLTLGKIEWQLKTFVDGFQFYSLSFPIAPYSSQIPEINRFFTEYPFTKKEDPGQYLKLADQYPHAIEQILSLLQEQYREQIVYPKEGLLPIIAYYESLLQPAEKSFLYVSPGRLKTAGIFKNPTEADQFKKKLTQIISTRINPALEKLLSFIKGDYLNAAPGNVGLWQYPGGKEYYKYLVKANTELDITPEEIHQTGLEQLEILNKELDAVRREIKFEGDLETFRLFIKNDPQFRLNSAEEMGERMMKFKEQAEIQLPRFFLEIPAAPCDVKRLEPALEATMTYGFYTPPMPPDNKGYYHYNGSNPKEKNRLNMACAALILHELVPGHHFHIAYQSKTPGTHPLEKEMFNTAYTEGWGEYASSLGEEMGIYKDPYERLGRIMLDMFVTVRLVVDTGMNFYQWPRQKAKDMMKKYLLTSDKEIESETLRYSIDIPAQALAYKIGHLKIRELRKKTEQALGPKFDLREFHRAILENGAMPLFLLENHTRHFIDSKK